MPGNIKITAANQSKCTEPHPEWQCEVTCTKTLDEPRCKCQCGDKKQYFQTLMRQWDVWKFMFIFLIVSSTGLLEVYMCALS